MTTEHVVARNVRECRACELVTETAGPRAWNGPSSAYLVVQEESTVDSRAHRLLVDMLGEVGFDVEQVGFVGTVSCPAASTPTQAQASACWPNLIAQLNLLQSRWVVLAGNVALHAWRPDLGIQKARGHVLEPPNRRWRLFPVLSPGQALTMKRAEQVLLSDLQRLSQIVEHVSTADAAAAGLVDDSCVGCGMSIEDMAEHEVMLSFDPWLASYCEHCRADAPDRKAEAKESAKREKVQEKSGALF